MLFNFEPPATEEEMRAAALQYVRKVSGTRKPAKGNQALFDKAVDEVTRITQRLIEGLEPHAPPKKREEEAAKAKARAQKRYATFST